MASTAHTLLSEVVTELVAATPITVTSACDLVGIARPTHYRIAHQYNHYTPVADPIPHTERHQPAALTPAEHTEILEVLSSDEYAHLSVVQAYWRSFDAGEVMCSERTFYRVAATKGLVGDRRTRRRAAAAARRGRPVAFARAVGDLWSWDVTEIRGPNTQDRYKLYLVIDVFSRFPVAWRIEYCENTNLAVQMFTEAIALHGAPTVLHADNGAVMRSNDLIDALTEAGVLTSFSRPRVSDDNPFSESLFKTIKYDYDCPTEFDSIDHARTWTEEFLCRYATEHRHSGLGRHTPASVYCGTAEQIQQQRQQRLDKYHAAHPERFRRPPTAPELPGPTGINHRTLSKTS